MGSRVLFHIDINAYFASAEVLKDHSLEGKAFVVSNLNRRSVVTTASYEARAYGVNSAMPLAIALKKCPHLMVVTGDYSYYEALSERFFRFLKQFSPYLEPVSIDECYLDVTDTIKKFKRPLDLAWLIQKKVYEELGLPCSIGVSYNRFLAKMASDMYKPMGITVLRRYELPRKLWPLNIKDMYGIGNKSVSLLQSYGINTIGDIANEANEGLILKLLGKNGYLAIIHARGGGSNSLNYNHSIKSLSQSKTLDKDSNDYDELKLVLLNLAKKLSQRAKEEKVSGSLVSITIRYYDFTNIIRSAPLNKSSNDYDAIYEKSMLLLDQNLSDKSVRHLGIALNSLSGISQYQQLSLFDYNSSIDCVIEELNDNIPNAHFIKASDLLNHKK